MEANGGMKLNSLSFWNSKPCFLHMNDDLSWTRALVRRWFGHFLCVLDQIGSAKEVHFGGTLAKLSLPSTCNLNFQQNMKKTEQPKTFSEGKHAVAQSPS